MPKKLTESPDMTHRICTLRLIRAARNITQVDLAAAADVAPETISRAENGVKVPQRRTVEKLANALGWEPADLGFPFNDDPSGKSGSSSHRP